MACDTYWDYEYQTYLHAFGNDGTNEFGCQDSNCHFAGRWFRCHDKHGECVLAHRTPAEEVLGDIPEMEREDIERLLRRHPETVRYNRNRVALQVIGCGGRIIAHFPLRSAQSPALGD